MSGKLPDDDPQKSFISTYVWRTLQSQQRTSYAEAVTGFLKLGKNSLEDVLKISAKHGVFIERPAQNQPGDATEWIPQEKDEDDMAYFTPVTSEAHDSGFTYRKERSAARHTASRCQRGQSL